MRLLADENIPLPTVDALRAAGYEVASIAREAAGAPDPRVLERARMESRLLVTFDRDFGELVFARSISGHPGVIFLRFVPRTPLEPAELLLALAAEPDFAFEGYFTVVDRDHVRQRTLPA